MRVTRDSVGLSADGLLFRLGTRHNQRCTVPAQHIPAPTAACRTVLSGWRRPCSRATWSAMGIEAAPVLPNACAVTTLDPGQPRPPPNGLTEKPGRGPSAPTRYLGPLFCPALGCQRGAVPKSGRPGGAMESNSRGPTSDRSSSVSMGPSLPGGRRSGRRTRLRGAVAPSTSCTGPMSTAGSSSFRTRTWRGSVSQGVNCWTLRPRPSGPGIPRSRSRRSSAVAGLR